MASEEHRFYYLRLMAQPGNKPDEPIRPKFVQWAAAPRHFNTSIDDNPDLEVGNWNSRSCCFRILDDPRYGKSAPPAPESGPWNRTLWNWGLEVSFWRRSLSCNILDWICTIKRFDSPQPILIVRSWPQDPSVCKNDKIDIKNQV